MRYSIFIIAVYLLIGCANEQVIEDITFPTAQTQVAVYCFLTPADSIFASVKTLQTIDRQTKDSTASVLNARITLENRRTSQQVILRYLGHDGLYGCSQKELAVLAGDPYRLSVSPTSQSTTQAECTVPAQSAAIQTVAYGEPYDDGLTKRRRITFFWHDVSPTPTRYNYALIYQFAFQQPQSNSVTSGTNFIINEGITQSDSSVYYSGTIIDSPLSQSYHLLTMDSNLFRFFTMADKMKNIVRRDGSNDFFGAYQGIIPEFTNIENGYGVFGAYLITQKPVVIQ